MKRVLGLLAAAVGLAATTLAQPYFAQQSATIRSGGRNMSASSGNQFMVAEGANLGTFASYGVARWDLTTLKNNLNLQYGAANWRITQVDVVVTQTGASFGASGAMNVHYSTDDATDILTAACPFRWPLSDGVGDPVHSGTPLLAYTFNDCRCIQADTYTIYVDGDGGDRLLVADDITNMGDSSLTLVFEDGDLTVAASYRGMTGTATANPPELLVTAVPIAGNPPTANAGVDQTVTDTDVSGSESITLDGSASHANPPASSITNYAWTEGGSPIASGVSPTLNFTVGVHNVILTVTDNLGGTASDEVIITVRSGVQIVAAAGANSTVIADACDGTASITLDGTGSTYNAGTITSYTWTDDSTGAVVGTLPIEIVSLNLVGTHTFRLHVVGSGGETDDDVRTVEVRPSTVFAGHDFDSLFANFVNIVPAGPFATGDAFGVLQRGTGSIPFGLLDDSLATFTGDLTGIVNDKKLDAWFGSQDLLTATNTGGTGTATFDFTIAGHSNIMIAIDMGAMGDYEATGTPPDEYTFTASVDGGAAITVFSIRCDEALAQDYRLGSGTVRNLADPLKVDGTTVLTNLFRTFSFPLGVTGSSLTLTLSGSGDGDDEAFAFDNILLYECTQSNPCPCAGDLNGDGLVDISDLALFLSSFGTAAP
ncbi:MAG: PKD domain-containing protein, partial [Planctomycetes bacterium]|nr:PKD domain-containing protein [Planctomycetota bacterium]